MKIYAISDLHLTNTENKPMDVFGINWVGHWEQIKQDWASKVDSSDVVLICGDVSWAMTINNALVDLQEIDKLSGKKIIIRGNHDYWWSSYKKIKELPLNTITFIQNNALKLGNYIFCGTRGWTVEQQSAEDKKIIDREIIRLKLTLDEAKKLQTNNEKIVVMLHYPPFNAKFDNSAFTELISLYDIEKVVYGHLHGSASRYKDIVNKGITNYYLTSCDFLNNNLLQIY